MHPIRFLRRPDVRLHPLRFAARRIQFETARRLNPKSLTRERVVQIEGGVRMSLRLDDLIEETIWLFGLHEFAAASLFTLLVTPGMTVIDAGAHVGQFTLLAADRAGPAGRVFAFEPNDVVRARLERNVALNGFANVTVSSSALSDRTGEATLEMPAWAGANSGVASLRSQGTAARTARVQCVRLDDQSLSPDVLKVDVEGLETEVFTGAATTIERHHPAIIFEVNEGARSIEALRSRGYAMHGIVHTAKGWRLQRVGAGEDPSRFREQWQALNLVALHPETKAGRDLVR